MTEIERIRAVVDNAKANNVPVYSLNTQDLDDLLAALDILEAGSRPYKVYSAIINQAGGGNPVATILENTLGGDPVWSYSDDGQFGCTLAGIFTASKTLLFAQQGNISSGTTLFFFRATDDFIALYQWDIDGSYVNGIQGASVEIRVYP